MFVSICFRLVRTDKQLFIDAFPQIFKGTVGCVLFQWKTEVLRSLRTIVYTCKRAFKQTRDLVLVRFEVGFTTVKIGLDHGANTVEGLEISM